jgi:hypothetical protein
VFTDPLLLRLVLHRVGRPGPVRQGSTEEGFGFVEAAGLGVLFGWGPEGEARIAALAEPTGEGEWKVEVTLARAEPGVVDTTLVVTTDLPGEERIEVPLYADVRTTP